MDTQLRSHGNSEKLEQVSRAGLLPGIEPGKPRPSTAALQLTERQQKLFLMSYFSPKSQSSWNNRKQVHNLKYTAGRVNLVSGCIIIRQLVHWHILLVIVSDWSMVFSQRGIWITFGTLARFGQKSIVTRNFWNLKERNHFLWLWLVVAR